MKQFYLLLLTLFCQAIFAQNWQPLMRKDTLNFKHKDSLFITQSVWVKNFTATNQGDSTFYLNLIGNHFVMTNYPTGNNYQCSEGIAYNQPHFLQKEAVKRADSTWIFQGPNVAYYFKPFAQLNVAWLFDATNNITANVVAIDTFSVAGQTDSVKKVLLSTGDSIFLSKNHGILRFPTFDSTLYVEWAGIQSRSLGDTIFHYSEIFDFEVGDVFYYNVYRGEGGGMIPGSFDYNNFKKVKATVTNKIIGLNSLQYDFHCDIQTQIGYMGPYSFSIKDTTLFYYSANTKAYNAYPHQYTNNWGGYALMDWDSTFSCFRKSFPYRYINASIDTIWGGECFEWIGHGSMKYGKGIGLIHSGQFNHTFGAVLGGSGNDTTLVGYIKNGISVGTIYPDWQFTSIENPQNDFFTLSPNPVKDQFSISFSKGNSFNIHIWDMQGREKSAISSPNSSITFHINDWAKGLYFVEVKDEKGNVFTEKFVKE